MNRVLASLEIVWEVPLALLSFLFYKVTRFVIHAIVYVQARVNKRQATEWRVLDAQALRAPLNLPALMTSAPRWNTHAIIALVGPLSIQRAFRLQVSTAARSARSWTIVVHTSPDHRIVASLDARDVFDQEAWQTVHLPPGNYRLALRYYHWAESIELPAIEVDGIEAVPATAISANVNDFYHDLGRRSNLFYLCLHYYIGPLLRYRKGLPKRFVEQEYLPAGNPQTTFYYGFLKAGEAMAFEIDPGLLQSHDVYVTTYNRASFPLFWYRLQDSWHITPPMPDNGTYLVRVHQKRSSSEPFNRDRVLIRTLALHSPNGERQAGAQQLTGR